MDARRSISRPLLKQRLDALAGDAPLVEFAAADEVLLTKTEVLDLPFPVASAMRLLREGAIKARGRLKATQGLPGIVLGVQDLETKRTRPRLPDAGNKKVVGFNRLARRLGFRLPVARQLANVGAIPAQVAITGKAGRRTPVFDPKAIEAFERDFVVIDELDRRLPQSRKEILALLQRRGVARQGPTGVPAPAYFPRAAAEAALRLAVGSP